MEELAGASPGFRPATVSQLQEELERQEATLGEDIRHLRALLAADCKHAIKVFWGRRAQDIVRRWKELRGAIEVEAPALSALCNVRVPNTQTLLTEAHDVMFAVRAFWQELYDKRPVDLLGFQAVLSRHVPGVREGAWTWVQQYSMQDLRSVLDKANGKAPGPNHVEARFIKALPAPVQWLFVRFYRAILSSAPPPMHWRDAHILLSPRVPGSARLDDYRPIALGQLDMKLLTGPLTQRITEVLTRHGVVSDSQQGALPGSNTAPPLFIAQRQLQRGRPNYFFSFDARKAFDTLRHLSVPPEVIDLLLFLHTCARLRIVSAHGLTQPVEILCSVWLGNPESPLLYALLLAPLLRAQGHRLRPPGEAKMGPHPGIYRRPAGSGPHAAALCRGRGGNGHVPRDDGHGAQPPQVRHGHHGGGPGPTATPLPPPGKPASDNGGRHPPRGRPSATPTASYAGPQGRRLWGRCWVPTPSPTASGTHGSQNPGCPPQRTGGWRGESA